MMEANDFMGAIATYNADAFLVETDEVAEKLLNFINANGVEVAEFAPGDEDFEWICGKLDLTAENKVKKVYAAHAYNASGCFFCLAPDWDNA